MSGPKGAQRVILARRRDTADQDDTVHLFPLPLPEHNHHGAATALCGIRLRADQIATADPGHGGRDWCTMCFTAHVTGGLSAPYADPTVAGRAAAVRAYTALGWPITHHREEIRLDLDDAVALLLPAIIAAEVTELLVSRRCPPAVIAHPATPAHRVILAGDRYAVPLPWPAGVQRITSHVVLPPTTTARGPVLWARAPERHSLRFCREIDVLAALRAALTDEPQVCPPGRSVRLRPGGSPAADSRQ